MLLPNFQIFGSLESHFLRCTCNHHDYTEITRRNIALLSCSIAHIVHIYQSTNCILLLFLITTIIISCRKQQPPRLGKISLLPNSSQASKVFRQKPAKKN